MSIQVFIDEGDAPMTTYPDITRLISKSLQAQGNNNDGFVDTRILGEVDSSIALALSEDFGIAIAHGNSDFVK